MRVLLISFLFVVSVFSSEEDWLRENSLKIDAFDNDIETESYPLDRSKQKLGVTKEFVLGDGMLTQNSNTYGVLHPAPKFEEDSPIAGALFRFKVSIPEGKFDFLKFTTYRKNGRRAGNANTYFRYDENSEWIVLFLDFTNRKNWEKIEYLGVATQLGWSRDGRKCEIDYVAYLTKSQLESYRAEFGDTFLWRSGLNDVSGYVDFDSDGLADIEEEHFLDTDPLKYDPPAIAELGSFSLEPEEFGQWITVKTKGVYENPVVIIEPMTEKASSFVVSSVRNITQNSFDVKLSGFERNIVDTTQRRQVNYWFAEVGEHTLANGKRIEAGMISSTNKKWENIEYSTSFEANPLLFLQSEAVTSGAKTIVRVHHDSTDENGFKSKLQASEYNEKWYEDEIHERIMWIALEEGDERFLNGEVYSVKTERSVSHQEKVVNKVGALSFSNLVSYYGANTASSQLYQDSSEILNYRVIEESSLDEEKWHTREKINIFSGEAGFLGFFHTTVDANADGLPDVWQRSNQLLGENSGYYDDKDNDKLSNYEEYIAGTYAYLKDSDGNGLSDYQEVVGLENPDLAITIGEFEEVLSIDGSEFISSFGAFRREGSKAIQIDRRGSVTYEFQSNSEGVHAVEFQLSDFRAEDYSKEHEFVVSLNGKFLSREYIFMPARESASFSVMLPSLTIGAKYSLTLFIDNSYRFRRVSVDQVLIKDASGTDVNGNNKPDWEEIRAQALNGADRINFSSYVSPACIQGKVEYFDFMNSSVKINKLPNNRWYSDVVLVEDEITSVENMYSDSKKESLRISWKAIDPKSFEQQLYLRSGDSILLSSPVKMNGILQSSGVLNFPVSGNYRLEAEGNTFDVVVVDIPEIEPTVAMVEHPRDWRLNVSEDLRLLHDNTVSTYLGNNRVLRLNPTSSEDSLIAFETPSGAILSTVPIHYNRLRSGSKTGLIQIDKTETKVIAEMANLLDKPSENLIIRSDIFIGWVTFDDGTKTKEVSSREYNDFGMNILTFYMPLNPHSNCHRNSVLYRGEVIARYK